LKALANLGFLNLNVLVAGSLGSNVDDDHSIEFEDLVEFE